jgi:hypothetical protein
VFPHYYFLAIEGLLCSIAPLPIRIETHCVSLKADCAWVVEGKLHSCGISILQRKTPEIVLPGRLSFEKSVDQSSGAESPKDRA